MAREHRPGLLIRTPGALAVALVCALVYASPGQTFCVTLRAQDRPATTLDRLMAVVEGQPITLSDVRAARLLGLASAEDETDAVVAQLIDRELVRAEVSRFAPANPSREAIDARLARVAARFPAPEAFEQAVAATGLTMEQARALVGDEIRMAAYLEQRFGAAEDRRRAAIDQWVESLRRRAEITIVGGP